MNDVRILVLAVLQVAFVASGQVFAQGEPSSQAATAAVEFTAAFRDGTLARVRLPAGELPWRRIAEDGEVLHEPLSLSKVTRLDLVRTPATEQVSMVRKLVYQLGDRDFHVREEAQQKLVTAGQSFRKIVEQARQRSNDYEVNWRLDEVLESIDPSAAGPGANYDLLTIAGGEKEINGDVADWKIVAKLRDADVEIDRTKLLALYLDPPEMPKSAASAVVAIERIPRDEDALFPANVQRIDFDRGPRGEMLEPKTNVGELYVPMGVTFATSIPESYIGVQTYNVRGRSQGRCAANEKELYQGTMTIRFCKPGNAAVPAGVRYVGFWTSHVIPNGTFLQAFDVSGKMIAEIPTVKEMQDFVALKSSVPIAYIKIVPTLEDKDYAIDDLTFDPPALLAEAGDPDRYSVLLDSGERLQAASMNVAGDEVTLGTLSVGVASLSIPRDSLAVVVPPRKSGDGAAAASDAAIYRRCFVRMTDGSVFQADGEGSLKLARFPMVEPSRDQIVALWGSKTDLVEPKDADWQGDAALAYVDGKPVALSEWSLGAERVESPQLADAPGAGKRTYADSPLIWFKKPSPRSAESGVLRLTTGEEIVLVSQAATGMPAGAFSLTDWNAEQVSIASGESKWSIPMSEVASFVLPAE